MPALPHSCQHKFLLPPPAGPTVMGRCHKCGLVREMFNTLQEPTWARHNHGKLAAQKGQGAV